MKTFVLARVLMYLLVVFGVPLFFTSAFDQVQFNLQIGILVTLYFTIDVAHLIFSREKKPNIKVMDTASARRHILNIYTMLDTVVEHQKRLTAMVRDNTANEEALRDMIKQCDTNVGSLIEVVDMLTDKALLEKTNAKKDNG